MCGTNEHVGATHVWPVGSRTGSLKHLKDMGQKKVAGAPASAARTSKSPLSGPLGRTPADGDIAEHSRHISDISTAAAEAVPGTSLAALAASGTFAPI